ncbi:MAG TPA: hypothetical protein VN515_00265 [Terriglobales bacterium]|nr:hypothetical protein [Terriglobales bacterium]
MHTLTATELARNLSQVLDRLAAGQDDEVVIERNQRPIARLVPALPRQTAMDVLGGLYRTLPDEAAASWEADIRGVSWKDDRLQGDTPDPWLR